VKPVPYRTLNNTTLNFLPTREAREKFLSYTEESFKLKMSPFGLSGVLYCNTKEIMKH